MHTCLVTKFIFIHLVSLGNRYIVTWQSFIPANEAFLSVHIMIYGYELWFIKQHILLFLHFSDTWTCQWILYASRFAINTARQLYLLPILHGIHSLNNISVRASSSFGNSGNTLKGALKITSRPNPFPQLETLHENNFKLRESRRWLKP